MSFTIRTPGGGGGIDDDASESVFMAKYLARETGLTPSDYADLSELFVDSAVRTTVKDSSVSWIAVLASSMGMAKYLAGASGNDPELYADMNELVAGSGVPTDLAGSQESLDAIFSTEVATDVTMNDADTVDAMAASDIAVDEIVATRSAMDAIATDAVSLASLLSSPFVDKVWNASVASKAVWENGVPVPPADETYHEALIVDDTDSAVPAAGTWALRWAQTDDNNSGPTARWDIDIDFTDIDTLEVETGGTFDTGRWQMKIWVGSDTLLATYDDTTTVRQFDVSSYTGVHALGLGGENEQYTSGFWMDFGNIKLIPA